VPWAYKYYICGKRPPECPKRPEQLYKWAWDVERDRKKRKEKHQQREEEERMGKKDEPGDLPETVEVEIKP
jgi:hypothetical protein